MTVQLKPGEMLVAWPMFDESERIRFTLSDTREQIKTEPGMIRPSNLHNWQLFVEDADQKYLSKRPLAGGCGSYGMEFW